MNEQDLSTEQPVSATPEQLAIEAWEQADPDADPVTIRSAWRDLSCSGSGPEAYRKVRYPGRTTDEWPDAERLPAKGGYRASERRATVHCEVPPGTLVTTYERSVYRGARGRCSISFAIAYRNEAGEGKVFQLTHKTLRSRPVYQVQLPGDLGTVEVPRRD